MPRIIAIFVLLFIIIFIITGCQQTNTKTFAQCLAEKGVVVFGSHNCPLTKQQQELFGGSWKYIPYKDCILADGQTSGACTVAKIPSYPTWVFLEEINGSKAMRGVLSLETLSNRTGCKI